MQVEVIYIVQFQISEVKSISEYISIIIYYSILLTINSIKYTVIVKYFTNDCEKMNKIDISMRNLIKYSQGY